MYVFLNIPYDTTKENIQLVELNFGMSNLSLAIATGTGTDDKGYLVYVIAINAL